MARPGNQTTGLNEGTSQFYILTNNQTAATYQLLDGYYTIFGKVISGMNVVCGISKVQVYPADATQNGKSINDQPINPVFLDNVTIISATQAPSPQPIQQCKY
jgi:cyclophilin family peptidyl-prolyl cis-trans isomerase